VLRARESRAGYAEDIFATLKRTIREFQDDHLTDWAAALTYYAVLGIFPALIALVSLVGLFGDPRGVTNTLTEIVTELGPESAADTLEGPIESITSNRSTAGVLFFVGLGAALWSASGYVGAFMHASNEIYETREGRPFWKLRPLQILLTLICIVLLALTVTALVATGPLARAIGESLGVSDAAVTAWDIAKWPVLLLLVMTMISLLYYASPNVKLPGFRWVTPGSLAAVAIWILASLGFAFYVSNFGSYDKTYGTLGGVVTFLVWLWISNIAVLFGAELNSEIERERELEHGLPAERKLHLPPRDPPEASPV
jgi:membrane protein